MVEEFNEENTVKTEYGPRKSKKMETFQKYAYEEIKETPELAVAAHFIADPSKYNVKTHTHYSGNNI